MIARAAWLLTFAVRVIVYITVGTLLAWAAAAILPDTLPSWTNAAVVAIAIYLAWRR